MSVLNVAILGQGRSGRSIHADALTAMPDLYRIAAVVDPLPERRAYAEQTYSCQAFATIEELPAEGIDLVVNATPSPMHADVTGQLLERGFNVLTEKPSARTVADFDRLVETAERAGRTLAFFQQSRYADYFQAIRKVIESGVLGRIVQIGVAFSGFARRWDWQCLQSNAGGNLLNTGPHPLDQALQLMGASEVPDVWAHMDRANTFGDAEDFVHVMLTSPGCPLVDLEISSCAAYPKPTYEIQGTLGGLRATQKEAAWRYLKPEELPTQRLITEPLTDSDGRPAYCREDLTWHTGSWAAAEGGTAPGDFGSWTRQLYEMLHAHLTEGAPLTITADQVRQQVAVIEAAHEQTSRGVGATPSA